MIVLKRFPHAAIGSALISAIALVLVSVAISGCKSMAQGAEPIVEVNQKSAAFGPPYGLVWAHEVYGVRSYYGGMQVNGQVRTLQAALSDGIDAVCFNCFNDASKMTNILQAGDQTGMLIAPTIDMSVLWRKRHLPADQIMQAEAQTIEDYCNLAAGHHSAAKTRDGRYIVWLYGSHQLTTDQQSHVISSARSQGARFYIVGDLGAIGADEGGDRVSKLTQYASVFDGSYAFMPLEAGDKAGVKSTFAGLGKPFIYNVMPQYTRQGMRTYLAPDGGARYGAAWQEAINDRAPAVVITTLNDSNDGSAIMPDYESQTKQYAQQWKQTVLGR